MNTILSKLRDEIEREVLPLIDNNYVLYGLPFYSNIGDVLIWEGAKQLLQKSKYKCVGSYASSDVIKDDIPQNVIIIVLGGGFFGDVWRSSFEYVLSSIKNRVHHKIIFLPNSISYKNELLLKQDIDFLSGFNNLYICLRDG